jgi:3-oxoacyl-[acyl-carrier protein] reductase
MYFLTAKTRAKITRPGQRHISQPMSSRSRNQDLKGKLAGEVAIVTGGSGEIGSTTAHLFADEGAKVAVHYSGHTEASTKRVKKIVSKLTRRGLESMPVRANVSNYEEVKSAVDQVVEKWGKVSLVVCTAGLQATVESWNEDPLEMDDEALLSAVKVDFLGSFHFLRACKDLMKKNGYGKFVFVSSSPTIYGEAAGYRYSLAKSMNRFTVKSFAETLIRNYGIYLNAIAPGTIDTPSNRLNYSPSLWKKLVSYIPLNRAGKAEEISRVALFLCSHDSDYVVGQTIVADGGEIRL